jgi:hypothetical protein
MESKNIARALFIADEVGSSTTHAIPLARRGQEKEKNDLWMGPALAHCRSRAVTALHRWEASTSVRLAT